MLSAVVGLGSLLVYFATVHGYVSMNPDSWNEMLATFGDEGSVFLWGTQLVHLVAFGGTNLCLLVLYWAELPFVEKYKTEPGPWSWRDPRPEERAKFWELLRFGLLQVSCWPTR
jgi:hypothetical protein